jgi:hypothetical protein
MKKGLIVYVTEGKEEMAMQDWTDYKEALPSMGASAVCVATSEDEIVYSWWRLLTRGMHQVSCITASFDALHCRLEPHGTPLRLYG